MSSQKGHRWFAASYDFLTRSAEQRVLHRLRKRVVGAASGRILELGVGTGANLSYYKSVEHLVATDPDPFMLARARKRAEALNVKVEFHQAPAEAIPFADASFDTVVSTLVLCTVDDQSTSLAEAKRVLKPGGAFRFIEHVRAEGFLGKVQDFLTPAWRWFGAGCHPNRQTTAAFKAAGFEIVELERRPLWLTPLVIGVARPTRLAR
ncbi:MAG: class I SAM-dependent methyltransferase [Chloroflexi bacterium]|nr:class I SAM-dependent methyltransferase [Chloroflexota bacterium]